MSARQVWPCGSSPTRAAGCQRAAAAHRVVFGGRVGALGAAGRQARGDLGVLLLQAVQLLAPLVVLRARAER